MPSGTNKRREVNTALRGVKTSLKGRNRDLAIKYTALLRDMDAYFAKSIERQRTAQSRERLINGELRDVFPRLSATLAPGGFSEEAKQSTWWPIPAMIGT